MCSKCYEAIKSYRHCFSGVECNCHCGSSTYYAHKAMYDFMDDLTYKPGYNLNLRQSGIDYYLDVTMRTVDSVADTQSIGRLPEIKIGQTFALPPGFLDYWSAERFAQFIERSILDIERHELDEWLKLDGVHLRNPHP